MFFCAAPAGGQHAVRGGELPSQAVLQQSRERQPWAWTGPSKPNCPLIPEAPSPPRRAEPGCQALHAHTVLPRVLSRLHGAASKPGRTIPLSHACCLPKRAPSAALPLLSFLFPLTEGFSSVLLKKKKKEATHPAVRARLFIPAETTPAFSPPAPQRAGGEPGKEALTLQARACWSIIRSLSRRRGTRRLIWSAPRPRWRVVQAPWPRQHWPHCLPPGADKPVPAEPLQTAIKCASSPAIRTRCAKLAASQMAGHPRPITSHEVLTGRSSSRLLALRRGKAPRAERALERPRRDPLGAGTWVLGCLKPHPACISTCWRLPCQGSSAC